MKLRILCVLALAGCLLVGTDAFAQGKKMASADDFCGRLYVAPEVLGFFPQKSAVKDSTFVGLRGGYEITENFAAEIETGWVSFDVRHNGRNLATLDNVPILANARYSFLGLHNDWDIFVLGGLGVGINTFGVEDEGLSGKSQSGTFAAQKGGGVEYRFTDTISVTGDVRYYWNDPRARIKAEGQETNVLEGIKSDSFVAGGSLQFKF